MKKRNTKISIVISVLSIFALTLYINNEILAAQCQIGGPGQSFCEYRAPLLGGDPWNTQRPIGCSVTCREGYYACCSKDGCFCYLNGGGPS